MANDDKRKSDDRRRYDDDRPQRDRHQYGREDYGHQNDFSRGDYGERGYGGGGYGRSAGADYPGRGQGYEGARSTGGYGGRGERHDEQHRERGFMDRASDEVSSWFGNDDAERRRRMDERERGQHRGRGPKGYKRTDARILEEVNDRLADDPFVDASEIEVRVAEGEVTLTGTVDDRNAKRRAEDLAEHVSGVAHVQNNLRVKAGA